MSSSPTVRTSSTPSLTKESRESKQKVEDVEAVHVEGDNDSEWEGTVQIEEKRLTWVQAGLLLLTEYVVLAILAFPSSFAVLGMAGGTIATLLIGAATLWTSHVLWRYCMKYPAIRDICDVALTLTGKQWCWYAAFVGLAFNNYAIMGLHVNAGGTAIQTIRQGTECTLVWGVTITVIMFLGSLLRDFKHLSLLGLLASSTMFICVLIVLSGHSIQGTPNGFDVATGFPTITTWAPEGTTFVQILNAVLNITYTWVGQALIPSFVGDMEKPEDFPKALYLSMAAEFLLFTVTGAYVYSKAGTQYTTAPAYGSLIEKYGKIAAGFTLPTIIIVGILYSLVTSRAVFFKIFKPHSVHRRMHTVKGWTVWVAIVTSGWIISFIIGEAVPFFNDLLALISSVFDSWFGFIFWGAAWYQLNKGVRLNGGKQITENITAALMIITGAFFFVAGTYTSIQSILDSYATGAVKKPFQCTNTGFDFTR